MVIEEVGTGLIRALYSTYLSFLSSDQIYTLPEYGDHRGRFVEMLKTRNSGQFAFFTASWSDAREHYHHSKNEKFLVIRVSTIWFSHIVTDQTFEILTDGSKPEIVETVPGWAHNITNVSDDEMIVMIWANEIFDRQLPDTFPQGVDIKKLRVISVVGTRPEIIRLSRVLSRLDEICDHIFVHTGQNYDFELNQVLLMGIRKPDCF